MNRVRHVTFQPRPIWYQTVQSLKLEDSCCALIRSGLNLAYWSTLAHEGSRPAKSCGHLSVRGEVLGFAAPASGAGRRFSGGGPRSVPDSRGRSFA